MGFFVFVSVFSSLLGLFFFFFSFKEKLKADVSPGDGLSVDVAYGR